MVLSENKRIVLNVAATCLRSLYTMFCGLFTNRWALLCLGAVDFGLFGLIGGMVAFISFFNSIIALGLNRFYAYSIGEARNNPQYGLEECRKWFNVGVLIHTVIPVILLIIGYPVGQYAIRHWLTIPADRILQCIIIWRYVCVSCFAAMVVIPFSAMYTAKQYIAELTVYNFATATLKVAVLYYMVTHPGEWLVFYALIMCLEILVPNLLIAIRACVIFPECKLSVKYFWNMPYIVKILTYSGLTGLGAFGNLLRTQGLGILGNIFFGPVANASIAVDNSITHMTTLFSGNMTAAFAPAITTACGQKDFPRVYQLNFQICKFGTALILLFAIPVAMELHELLILWLKNPPLYAEILCYFALGMLVVNNVSGGHWLTINATGKIKEYQIIIFILSLLTLACSCFVFQYWGKIYSGHLCCLGALFIDASVKVIIAKKVANCPVGPWLKEVLLPLAAILIITCSLGLLPRCFLPASILRILISACWIELLFLPLCYFFLLKKEERTMIFGKIKTMMHFGGK